MEKFTCDTNVMQKWYGAMKEPHCGNLALINYHPYLLLFVGVGSNKRSYYYVYSSDFAAFALQVVQVRS